MPAKTPRPEQERAIQRIRAEPTRAALIGSEVGAGKTLITAEVIARNPDFRRVLIIGIKHTFDQWAGELSGQSDERIILRRLDSTKAGEMAYADFLAGEDGVFFATIQWLQTKDYRHDPAFEDDGVTPKWATKKINGVDVMQFHELPEGMYGPAAPKRVTKRVHLRTFAKMSRRKDSGLDLVVFDEAHAVANRKSTGRTTLCNMLGRRGFEEPFKVALSATWSGNSFENAWSVPEWLWPDQMPAFHDWRAQWVRVEPVFDERGRQKYGRGQKALTQVVGEKMPGEFVKTLPCYIRDESKVQAPTPMKVYVDLTPEQRQQYEDLKADLITWVQGFEGEEMPLVVDVPGALHTRLKQATLGTLTIDESGEVSFPINTRSSKLAALSGLIRAWGDQPVLIYVTGSKKFARVVAARMSAAGFFAEAWDGSTSEKNRKRIKADFMEGRLKYIVALPEAIGTGTDGLQTVCSKMVWLSSPDGAPVLEEQGVGRLARPGHTEKYGRIEDVRLLCNDTLDVEKLDKLIAQAWMNRRSLATA